MRDKTGAIVVDVLFFSCGEDGGRGVNCKMLNMRNAIGSIEANGNWKRSGEEKNSNNNNIFVIIRVCLSTQRPRGLARARATTDTEEHAHQKTKKKTSTLDTLRSVWRIFAVRVVAGMHAVCLFTFSIPWRCKQGRKKSEKKRGHDRSIRHTHTRKNNNRGSLATHARCRTKAFTMPMEIDHIVQLSPVEWLFA